MAGQTITASGKITGPDGPVLIATVSTVPETVENGGRISLDHTVRIGGHDPAGPDSIDAKGITGRSGFGDPDSRAAQGADPAGPPAVDLAPVDLAGIAVRISYTDSQGAGRVESRDFPRDDPAIQPVPGGYRLATQALELGAEAMIGSDITVEFTTRFDNGEDMLSIGIMLAPGYVCFAGTAMIMSDRGEVHARELQVGDLVLTRDHGFQPIRWIGRRTVPAAMLGPQSRIRPVRIRAGALGPHSPQRDLLVSPQHRLLIASEIARRMFGSAEVLVAAHHLIGHPGIEVAADLRSIEYVHFAFDQHQLVFADGAVCESLFAGPQALAMLTPPQRAELLAIFPEWADPQLQITAIRPIPRGSRIRALVARHNANRKALVSAMLH